jgi:hypothetical protein
MELSNKVLYSLIVCVDIVRVRVKGAACCVLLIADTGSFCHVKESVFIE